jgi:hypothetical protein
MDEGRVIRAPTPPRKNETTADGRAALWELRNARGNVVRTDLVGLIDGVELEIFRGHELRRRWRFLTDSSARGYAARLRTRLERRGFWERRGGQRTSTWIQ